MATGLPAIMDLEFRPISFRSPPNAHPRSVANIFMQGSADRIVWPFKPTGYKGKLMIAPLTSGAKRGAGVHDEPDLAARPETLPVGGTAPQDRADDDRARQLAVDRVEIGGSGDLAAAAGRLSMVLAGHVCW